MKPTTVLTAFLVLLAGIVAAGAAQAGQTVYFSPGLVATLVDEGVTSDTISCQGYLFTYTRDKLFTGGGSVVIGRGVRVPWPAGVEAQYVTAGPAPTKAQITVQRVDGGVFDLTSFTAHLLANAGAGRAIEIVPLLGGEEPLNDPLFFDVSGNYGNEFSYDTSPNPWGSTAALTGYDTYRINLTLDFALTALVLTDASTATAVPDGPLPAPGRTLRAAPNPAGSRLQVSLDGDKAAVGGTLAVFDARGARVRQLEMDTQGRATWDLDDAQGRPAAAGVYFLRLDLPAGPVALRRVVVAR